MIWSYLIPSTYLIKQCTITNIFLFAFEGLIPFSTLLHAPSCISYIIRLMFLIGSVGVFLQKILRLQPFVLS